MIIPISQSCPIRMRVRAATCAALMLAALGNAAAHDQEVSSIGPRTTLFVFGPELPFMFDIVGERLDFRWADLVTYGNTAIGTLENGAGEVIGINREYWVADPTDPTPRKLTEEITPSGVVATFVPDQKYTVSTTVDLEALQTILDEQFVDTEAYAYLFRISATLDFVEYQLSGPVPNGEILAQIDAGDSQKAATIGTQKYTANDVPATIVGLRAPGYLNTVLEVPYHIHFLADDRSMLGHVTDLQADDLAVEWTRVNAVNIHMWDVK
ncbi:acetolactate decarboxylase [Nitratireductor sp. XY-223]|uniref:acetolactate decarboxylase n=1 Tax=Nitratireductor sp. XY-223 TaxID=2561926 RepID=UPI0010AB2B97|nr:acetolactate decarboxylase [Nitratireductor sp. XY-223]